MSNIVLARELFKTSMLLQDAFSALRRKEVEVEILNKAHEEELNNHKEKLESLKSQLLLMEMLIQTKPLIEAAKADDDEYTV
jgi:hypothetical protein